MSPRRPAGPWAALSAALLALAFVVYARGLHIGFYSDDFQFLFADPRRWLFAHFVEANPLNDFYRPVQMSVMAALQLVAGGDPTPLHALHIALHGALAVAVLHTLRRLGLAPAPAFFGASFVAVSQVGAHPVLSNDTLAQVAGTLFGFLSLTLLDRWLTEPRPRPAILILAAGALAVSLWSKETSIGFCLLIAALVILRRARGVGDLKGVVAIGLPFAAVAFAYLAARAAVVTSHAALGEARYQFALGMNLPQNLAMLVAAPLLPMATSTVFVAAKARDLAVLAAAAGSTAVFIALLGGGLWLSERRREAAVITLFCLGAAVPAVALNHVSEAYSYNLLPFLGLLVGLAAEGWGRRAAGGMGRVVGLCALGLLAMNAAALQVKAAQMQARGEEAASLLAQLTPLAADAPPGATLLLVSPAPDVPPYSIFLINGFEHLHFAEEELRRRAGRPDLAIERARVDTLGGASCPAPCLAFGLEGGRVIPLERSGDAQP